jgi:hypothetical protein
MSVLIPPSPTPLIPNTSIDAEEHTQCRLMCIDVYNELKQAIKDITIINSHSTAKKNTYLFTEKQGGLQQQLFIKK